MRKILAGLLMAASVAVAGVASAQTKITLGYTAVTDFASAFVAKEEGFFAKHGLDVELTLIALNSTIPAAIVSNSLQVGGPTPSVMIQAVDGGLDLVAIAGAAMLTKSTEKGFGVVTRAGSPIKTAQDFAGKKVGVPGVGAFLHVLFRQWLMQNNVDPKKVNFVEVSFPTMNDVLKAGTVEAVVTADPFMSRIVQAGTGQVAAYFAESMPEGIPTIVYAATRDWASKNPKAVAGFQAALVEAAAFMAKNDEKTRADMGKFIKVPPEVLKSMLISTPSPRISERELAWWTGVMKQQDMLQTDLTVSKLIYK